MCVFLFQGTCRYVVVYTIHTERSSFTPLEASVLSRCLDCQRGCFVEMRQGLDWNDGMMLVFTGCPRFLSPRSLYPMQWVTHLNRYHQMVRVSSVYPNHNITCSNKHTHTHTHEFHVRLFFLRCCLRYGLLKSTSSHDFVWKMATFKGKWLV